MQNNIDELRRMIYDLITDLEVIFTRPDEIGDIGSIKFFYNRLHIDRIKKHAIEKLLPYKNSISRRDLAYFDDNRYIFAGLPEDRISYYRNEIVVNKRLGKEDMDTMWRYLDAMVALTEKL